MSYRVRLALIRGLALFVICFGGASAEAATLKFDCLLPSERVSCQVLEKAFTGTMPFFTLVEQSEKAEILVEIREQAFPEKTVFEFRVIHRPTTTITGTRAEISAAESANMAMTLVLAGVQHALIKSPAFVPAGPGKSDEGIFSGRYMPADGSKGEEPTKWYVNPTITGSYLSADIVNGTLSADTAVNYSDPRVRFQAGAKYTWNKIEIPTGGGQKIEGELQSWGGAAALAYSLPSGWSVGAIVKAGHVPQENLDKVYIGGIGVEWSLMPFLKHNERNISVRYLVSYNHESYVLENVNEQMLERYLKHNLTVYFVWHFDRMDINLATGVSSLVNDLEYSRFYSFGAISWKLLKDLYIVPSIALIYNRNQINKPLSPDHSNPIQSFLMGGNFTELFYQMGLSLKYYFGSPRTDDQRWKDALD